MTTCNHTKTYSKAEPYIAKVKERCVLNKEGSTKKTYHVSLDLSGSGIEFEPGDAVGILPTNNEKLVNRMLSSLPRKLRTDAIKKFLLYRANLIKISPKLYKALNIPRQEDCDVCLLLTKYKLENIPPETFPTLFLPMMPRFYSIASSQMTADNRVDLLVATFDYQVDGQMRSGVGSETLCKHCEEIPLYVLKAHHFKLPEDVHSDIIMIGPGTGVAPYRAFMQEREQKNSKAKHWLFFGERHRQYDYYYEPFWKKLEQSGMLKLSLAFSRDQKEKDYVQHHLQKHGKELWDWIKRGATIYLCGDAKQMAKDVTKTLESIIQEYGNLDGKAFLKTLRREKRLQSDVY